MDSLWDDGKLGFLEKKRHIENWRGNNKGNGLEGGTGIKGLDLG